jgi:O-antigen ligase
MPDRIFQRLGQIILTALVGMVPLAMAFFLRDSFDLPKMFLVYLGAFLLVVLLALRLILSSDFVWRTTPLDFPLLMFLVVTFVSALVSWDRDMSLWGYYRVYAFGWFPLLTFAAIFWAAVQVKEIPVAAVVRWAAAVAALYGLFQYRGWEIFASIPSAKGGRVWSSLGNSLFLGSFLMMAIPFFWVALLRAKTGVARVFETVGLSLLMWTLLLTQSRSAWMGSVGGLILFFGVAVRSEPGLFRRVRVPLLLLGVGGICLLASLPAVRERLSVLVSTQESSNRARLAGWVAALNVAREHPILGTGPDTFFLSFRRYKNANYTRSAGSQITQAHAHNDLLQYAATTGILGLMVYLWLLAVFAVSFWRRISANGLSLESAALVAALFALFIQNLFNFSTVTTSLLAAIFTALWFKESALERPLQGIPWKMVGGVCLLVVAVLTPILIKPLWADALAHRGEISQDPNRALKFYDRALALAPWVDEYHVLKFDRLWNKAKNQSDPQIFSLLAQEVVNAAKDRRDRQPLNPDAHNGLGVALMRKAQGILSQGQGKTDDPQAEVCFKKALELDPTYVEAWANWARLLHYRNQLEEEIQVWRHVISLDPENETARNLLKQLGGIQ